MPFPYTNLFYDQLRRLRELSTPVEVYDLQLAVGNTLDGLLPFQSTKNVDYVIFYKDNTIPVEVYTHIVDELPTVITTDVVFIIRKVLIRDLSKLMTNRVSDILYFKKVDKLSTVTDGLTVDILPLFGRHLTDLSINGPLLDVKLSDIFAVFTKLRFLSVKNLNPGWIHELLDADACDIQITVYGEDNSFEDVFSFNPADLLQLLNKRCDINVRCENTDNETLEEQASKISGYLGPSLPLINVLPLPNFAVVLNYDPEPSNPESHLKTACIKFGSRALIEASGYIQNDVGFNFESDSEASQNDDSD
uniref:FTH domain-containing protein n=1 Tax=Panagrellus redivivus TaxID=6233 RepID=A0A7E4W134_PANRE